MNEEMPTALTPNGKALGADIGPAGGNGLQPLRVLAWVEGSSLHGAALKALLVSLSPQITVVGVANVLDDVVGLVETQRPDLALLHGLRVGWPLVEVVREVHKRFAETRTVLVVETVDNGTAWELLRAGVQGLFSGKVAPERLLAALQLITKGQAVLDPAMLAIVLGQAGDRSTPSLNAWELQVLRLVAEGMHNDEIAAQLAISTSTLKRNLRSIRDKLEVRSRVGAAAYAAKAGLL